MKRNYPSERSADLAEDSKLIEQRLNELYPTAAKPDHKIAVKNRGYYISAYHHVRLDSTLKLHTLQGLVQYCDTLNYYHANPYQALYLLDTRQLCIYYAEIPLSLAEAYKLLLHDRADAANYAVFSYLNRYGYYCFGPEALLPQADTSADSGSSRVSQSDCDREESSKDEPTKPLFQIDLMQGSYDKVLKEIGERGPTDASPVGYSNDKEFVIVFDAYKRETFSRNKPRRGKLGCPDWFVIVCDEGSPNSPKISQLSSFSLKYGVCARRKLLFALVDADNTISFVHFDPIHPSELEVNHDSWPEQISVTKSAAAHEF